MDMATTLQRWANNGAPPGMRIIECFYYCHYHWCGHNGWGGINEYEREEVLSDYGITSANAFMQCGNC